MIQEDERLLSKPILFLSYVVVVLPLLLFLLPGKPYYYMLSCTGGSRIDSHIGRFDKVDVFSRSKLKSFRCNYELEGLGNRGLLITSWSPPDHHQEFKVCFFRKERGRQNGARQILLLLFLLHLMSLVFPFLFFLVLYTFSNINCFSSLSFLICTYICNNFFPFVYFGYKDQDFLRHWLYIYVCAWVL